MRTTMTRTIPVLVALLLLGGGLAACRRDRGTAAGTQAARSQYHCPMHPTYVSDRPGQCPICKMDLVPIEPGAGAAPQRRILYYRSPMEFYPGQPGLSFPSCPER